MLSGRQQSCYIHLKAIILEGEGGGAHTNISTPQTHLSFGMYAISVTFVLLFTRIKHDFVVSNLLLLLSRRRFWVKAGKSTLL